jgi:hypothetical protein
LPGASHGAAHFECTDITAESSLTLDSQPEDGWQPGFTQVE